MYRLSPQRNIFAISPWAPRRCATSHGTNTMCCSHDIVLGHTVQQAWDNCVFSDNCHKPTVVSSLSSLPSHHVFSHYATVHSSTSCYKVCWLPTLFIYKNGRFPVAANMHCVKCFPHDHLICTHLTGYSANILPMKMYMFTVYTHAAAEHHAHFSAVGGVVYLFWFLSLW